MKPWIGIFSFLTASFLNSMSLTKIPLLSEQVRESSLVLRAKVKIVRPFLNGNFVNTEITFEPTEVFRGNELRKPFSITLPGGEVSGYHTEVHGVPQFKKGEEAILFLTQKNGKYLLPYMGFSKIGINERGEIENSAESAKILSSSEFKSSYYVDPGNKEKLSFDELIDRIINSGRSK